MTDTARRDTSLPAPPEDSRRIGTFVGPDASATEERHHRFREGVRSIRAGASLDLGERTLMILGGIIAPLGLAAVLLGWYGASRSPYVFEQIPYLISGGLFGVALVFLGAFFYFAHWMTELVKEHRSQSEAMLDAINRLHEAVEQGAVSDTVTATAAVSSNGSVRRPELVATERGSLAHLPTCTVVAGKNGIRIVAPDEELGACKLCDPYDQG